MKTSTKLLIIFLSVRVLSCFLGVVLQSRDIIQLMQDYRSLSSSSLFLHNEYHQMQQQQETMQQLLKLEINENSTSYCDIVKRSKLYSKECNNTGEGIPKRLLITGTGRSGTTLLTLILKGVGFRMCHDGKGDTDNADGAVSWPHAFDNSEQCPSPNWVWKRRQRRLLSRSTRETNKRSHNETEVLERRDWHFWRLAHVVRDPLKTIQSRWNQGGIKIFNRTSLCNTAAMSQPYIQNMTSFQDRTLLHTLQHWVLWNTYIEALQPSYRIQTETVNVSTIQKIYDIMVQDDDNNLRTATTDDHDNNNGKQQQPLPQLEPLSSKLNVSKVYIQEVLQSYMNASVNSGHTKKSKDPLSWNQLMKLDREYTIMAQLMSLRYGYPNVIDEHDDNNNYTKHLAQNYKQVCGFNSDKKWECYLKQIIREKVNFVQQ